jgi:hypothetical protein
MDDPEVAAAIAAGELEGLAAALDKYAASLYEYCYSMAPEVAADAVQDTFIIAWSKLDGLRDPGQLHPWLQAVAGNECFRRTLADRVTDADGDLAPEATPPPETTLPPGLPEQILSACADNTPGGRAHRTSVTHRAGPFGYDGFPKANALRGTWQRRFRRHRRAGAAVAAAAVLAAAAIMIVAMSPASSPHHDQASAASPGSGQAGGSTVSGTDQPTTRARPIPSSRLATSPSMAAPSATAAAGMPAGAPAGSSPVVPTAPVFQEAWPSPSLSLSPSSSPSPPPSPSLSPSPPPTPTPPPPPPPTHGDDVITAVVKAKIHRMVTVRQLLK